MTSFLATMKASFPEGMTLPKELEKLFSWVEARGFVRQGKHSQYATLYPREFKERGGSLVRFEPVYPSNASLWPESDDPAVVGPLAPFATTRGEGSQPALLR